MDKREELGYLAHKLKECKERAKDLYTAKVRLTVEQVNLIEAALKQYVDSINRIDLMWNKVDFDTFGEDLCKVRHLLDKEYNVEDIYSEIKQPKRATMYSAGHDMYTPYSVEIPANETVVIYTGLTCNMPNHLVMNIYPRSSMGSKGLMLCTTVSVVDADYRGHIWVKVRNLGNEPIAIEKGEAFCQAIFSKYYIAFDDLVETIRQGGEGSTGRFS